VLINVDTDDVAM